jgi:hypothetical protein
VTSDIAPLLSRFHVAPNRQFSLITSHSGFAVISSPFEIIGSQWIELADIGTWNPRINTKSNFLTNRSICFKKTNVIAEEHR